jgi:hypothetical protein
MKGKPMDRIKDLPAELGARLTTAWHDREREDGALSVEWIVLAVLIVILVGVAAGLITNAVNAEGKKLPQ